MSIYSAPYPPDPGYHSKRDPKFSLVSLCKPRIKHEAQQIACLHVHGTIKQLFQPASEAKPLRKLPRNHIKENILHVQRKGDGIKLKGQTAELHISHSSTAHQHCFSKKSLCHVKNFVSLNKQIPRKLAQSGISPNKESKERKIGEVPKYLQQRKKMWLKEKEREEKSIPDPSIPQGHIMMKNKDRVSTLQDLQQKKRDLMANLISLPILCHTVKQKNLKTDLETKLNEIDDAIKIFSRPKVYIKIA